MAVPYQIQSQCPVCANADTFVIGDWPSHFGVYICHACQMLVNIPVETGQCPGCHHQPELNACWDYSLSIPYLGGQMPVEPEPGPACPRCHGAPLGFQNTIHFNLGAAVVWQVERSRATWGMDYMEKAIFMNCTLPVIQEFNLHPARVFEYFHLHIPTTGLMTRGISYPIYLDIRAHLLMKLQTGGTDLRAGPIQ